LLRSRSLPCNCGWKRPLDLGPTTEAEPDLALVVRREDDCWRAHPTAAAVVLVIEVADASLTDDLEAKARLDAAAGIPHYWVVDVQQLCLHVLQGKTPAAEPWLADLRQAVEPLLSGLPQP
jgi:Uma2 family endonuclease